MIYIYSFKSKQLVCEAQFGDFKLLRILWCECDFDLLELQRGSRDAGDIDVELFAIQFYVGAKDPFFVFRSETLIRIW